MKIFKLPDLGEGLPDATIREWYVSVGDKVEIDQPLVAMETAKALVDIPSPFSRRIEKLFGKVGDVMETGHPLIGFEGKVEIEETKDSGTVVGVIEIGNNTILEESGTNVTTALIKKNTPKRKNIKAMPVVRMLAKQLGVNLATITPKGSTISTKEVKQTVTQTNQETKVSCIKEKLMDLSPVRRAMARDMSQSHREVVPVSLMDDADLSIWSGKQDITIRIIRAIESACKVVSIMNAHFDSKTLQYKLNESINIGIAVDTPQGLYVPVLKNISRQDNAALRHQINYFKELAQNRSFPAKDLHGATIMLSNFGTFFAGRYANPILIPPMVTIVGVGRIRNEFALTNDGKPTVRRILPLSITSDHRLITGGEIAQFLTQLIRSLEQ